MHVRWSHPLQCTCGGLITATLRFARRTKREYIEEKWNGLHLRCIWWYAVRSKENKAQMHLRWSRCTFAPKVHNRFRSHSGRTLAFHMHRRCNSFDACETLGFVPDGTIETIFSTCEAYFTTCISLHHMHRRCSLLSPSQMGLYCMSNPLGRFVPPLV